MTAYQNEDELPAHNTLNFGSLTKKNQLEKMDGRALVSRWEELTVAAKPGTVILVFLIIAQCIDSFSTDLLISLVFYV